MNFQWKYYVGKLIEIVGTVIAFTKTYYDKLPLILRLIISCGFYIGVLGILLTYVRAIINRHSEWRRAEGDGGLMYSYFCGSGQYQRKLIYSDAYKLLYDKTWLLWSAAGAGYKLGYYQTESRMKAFLLGLARIPLVVIGIPEMFFRVTLGTLYLFLINIVHWFVLLIINIVTLLLVPVFKAIDVMKRKEQHCTKCFATFKLPGYVCPKCKRVHKKLVPGTTGILVARCECGNFIPSSLISGRSKLESVCPECGSKMVATDAREFTLQVIGSDSSGKTAYMAAFQHMYRSIVSEKNVNISFFPSDEFETLEDMFLSGVTQESSKTSIATYTIVHKNADASNDSLVVYDVPDEAILSGFYENNPLNYGYLDGILLIIDPTVSPKVRKDNERKGQRIQEGSFAANQFETEDIIAGFIQQYSSICNRSSRARLSIPVAVLINKADLKAIEQEIGTNAIVYQYRSEPEKFGERYDLARNSVCREYLRSIGLYNAINNIESVFSNVNYYPISAMGHPEKQGVPFKPNGVIEPVSWIATQSRSSLTGLLSYACDIERSDSYEDKETAKALADRYIEAEKLLSNYEFEKAEKAYKALGPYKDSMQRAEGIKEQHYQYAKKQMSQDNYREAAEHFEALANYKDSKSCANESWLLCGISLCSKNDYDAAIGVFEHLGNYKDASDRAVEAKYMRASQLAASGQAKNAVTLYNALGNYKDCREQMSLLLPELIKEGVHSGLAFGGYTWRVIKEENTRALIITESWIGQMVYHGVKEEITWEKSDMRKYLNSDFLDGFNNQEKKMISSNVIKNTDNTEYGSKGGEDTVDAVFLLSTSEMREYFNSDEERIPRESDQNISWCWLRSPGGNNMYAAISDIQGTISDGGNLVNNPEGGYRPAMWVTL